jgi:hypothetical protein
MSKVKRTIEELEQELECSLTFPAALEPLIRQGFRPHVKFYGPERKMKRSASVDSWSPESGEIRIRFERQPATVTSDSMVQPSFPNSLESERGLRYCASCHRQTEKPSCPKCGQQTTLSSDTKRSPRSASEKSPDKAGSLPQEASAPDQALSDLIRALARVEARPGFNFVALKWFRDVALLDENFNWANFDSARRETLREATEKRLVLTNKIQNPKAPQYPVTTLRLNRAHPQVQAILGTSATTDDEFAPIEIRGEDLSATVLRERR